MGRKERSSKSSVRGAQLDERKEAMTRNKRSFTFHPTIRSAPKAERRRRSTPKKLKRGERRKT